MKFKGRDWRGNDITLSVSDLIDRAFSEQRDGVAESAQAQADAAMKALGRLAEALVDEGVLSAAGLRRMLGVMWPYGVTDLDE